MKVSTKILLTLALLLVGAFGYLAGRGMINLQLSNPFPSPSVAPFVPPVEPTPSPVTSPTPSVVASETARTQKVTGGGVLSFPRYELTIPSSWTYNRESNTQNDEKLTITNGTYTLSVQQGGFGGSACLYPGDPNSEGPAGRYIAYIELTTKSGDKLRRSTPESGQGFGLCQLTQYGWGAPTLYGHISLKVPASPTPSDLQVLDTILESFTKI